MSFTACNGLESHLWRILISCCCLKAAWQQSYSSYYLLFFIYSFIGTHQEKSMRSLTLKISKCSVVISVFQAISPRKFQSFILQKVKEMRFCSVSEEKAAEMQICSKN